MFLVPTASLQRSLLANRPLPPTANPRLALENRIERDRLFAERVASLAAAHGFETIATDGCRSRNDILAAVERFFARHEANREPIDLRPVRRWENDLLRAAPREERGRRNPFTTGPRY